MDEGRRLTALERLPELYSRALRLADEGHLPAEIARRLEMEISAVGPLLEVAKLKLADAMQALAVDEGAGGDPDDAAGPR